MVEVYNSKQNLDKPENHHLLGKEAVAVDGNANALLIVIVSVQLMRLILSAINASGTDIVKLKATKLTSHGKDMLTIL